MTKTCPFKAGFQKTLGGQTIGIDRHLQICSGKDCQLWVDVVQNRILVAGKTKFADENYQYHYEGCGLVQVTPWELEQKSSKEGDKK